MTPPKIVDKFIQVCSWNDRPAHHIIELIRVTDRSHPEPYMPLKIQNALCRREFLMTTLAAGTYGRQILGAEDRPLNVFLFAGQSNMAGADSIVTDPPGFQSTDADRATRYTGAPLPAGQQSPLFVPWGEMRGHQVSPQGKLVHGPEVGFARTLYHAAWRDLCIVKVFGNFSRDAKIWPWSRQGDMFDAWMRFADARIAELIAEGRSFRVRGFVWHQGIDDAIHGELARSYRQNLTELIETLRTRFDAASAPFVLARSVNSSIACSITGAGENDPMGLVRKAQVAIGNTVPRAGWIDVDDLPNVNRHHFSAEGQLAIGKRLGERFLKLVDA